MQHYESLNLFQYMYNSEKFTIDGKVTTEAVIEHINGFMCSMRQGASPEQILAQNGIPLRFAQDLRFIFTH